MPPPYPDLFEGLSGGISIAVLGPPGTGKSTLLGSVGKYIDPAAVKLLATKPRESNSWLYRATGITAGAEIFHDPKWRPSAEQFEAEGWKRLVKRIWELHDDPNIRVVIVDPFTDVVTLAMHNILAPRKVASPNDTGDGQGVYGTLRHRLKEITQALTALQFAKVPKHVLVAAHVQPAKEDVQLSRNQGGGTKRSQDHASEGIEYEGNVLPMIEGGYRREFASEFDVVVYSDVVHRKVPVPGSAPRTESSYVLQVAPDVDRHAKHVLGPLSSTGPIRNDFMELLTTLKGPS